MNFLNDSARWDIGARSRAAAPWHLKVVQRLIRVLLARPTGSRLWSRTRLEGLHISSGLETPQVPPGGAGNHCQGEGPLDPAYPGALGGRNMDGCFQRGGRGWWIQLEVTHLRVCKSCIMDSVLVLDLYKIHRALWIWRYDHFISCDAFVNTS